MKKVLLLPLLLLLVSSLHAQAPGLVVSTPPVPDPLEDAYHVSISGAYSMTTNEGTNNGFATSIAVAIAPHWNARATVFTITSPSTIVTLVGPEYRWSLAHWKAPNSFVDTSRLLPFVNLGVGATKNSNGVGKLAYSMGGGVDVKINDTLYLRPLDVSYVRSSVFQGGGIWVGNHMKLVSGFGLHF